MTARDGHVTPTCTGTMVVDPSKAPRLYVGSAGTSTGPLAPLCACVDSAVHTTLGSTVGGVAPSCFVPVARA